MPKSWSQQEFKDHIIALADRYYIHHPYHVAMHQGKLTREQIQGWVANRYYYQINIPRKDAAILANAPDSNFRRRWIQRIIDHDGVSKHEGSIEAWLVLAEATGMPRSDVISLEKVLPAVQFAVDAYVDFARHAPWQEAVCSSLTELFAPTNHKQRLADWPAYYPWIDPNGIRYFQKRLTESRRDVEHGLDVTLNYFETFPMQQRALQIVNFKLDVLWSMLDAMKLEYGIG